MKPKQIKKAISILTLITFIFTNTSYGAPSSRSLFKDKKVDYQKLSTQSEERLQKKNSIFKAGDDKVEKRKEEAKRLSQRAKKNIEALGARAKVLSKIADFVLERKY